MIVHLLPGIGHSSISFIWNTGSSITPFFLAFHYRRTPGNLPRHIFTSLPQVQLTGELIPVLGVNTSMIKCTAIIFFLLHILIKFPLLILQNKGNN